MTGLQVIVKGTLLSNQLVILFFQTSLTDQLPANDQTQSIKHSLFILYCKVRWDYLNFYSVQENFPPLLINSYNKLKKQKTL